jgi:hypothetical protein
VAEVIEDGVTGLLARQGDMDDLGAQLGPLLADPVLAKQISIAGRDRVLAEGSLERHADPHVRVLRGVLAISQVVRRPHSARLAR